ncbi:MAG: sigma-54-dependent Fis family transcriptional regulator [Ignavibacteriales bacterium]|nr:sigma-54-dependent Fis family transcriptional regulator [Ignavibacteriales bacterium]
MNTEVSTLKRRIEELEEIHRLAQSLSSMVNVYQTLEAIIDCCLKLCHAERGAILLFSLSADESAQTVVRNVQNDNRGIDHTVNSLVAGWVGVHKRPFLTDDVLRELNFKNPSEQLRQLGAAMAVPLMEEGKPFGMLHLINPRGGERFSDEQVRLVSAIAPLAAQFILRAKIQEAVFADNQRLKATLQKERGIGSILGVSTLIDEVRNKIAVAGPSNASVLLIGETGTGKEVAARAIHAHSPRADKPFIAVNCSAIPETLFESELFGHEKGSFTGATGTMKGKFEQADGGTLFLDEISAMPIDMQPKLLRVLEERSFCRIGSSDEHRVNIRVVAASNKDLQQSVQKNEFREDLFHRLNVIPIHLPALRERPEDVPVLARAFLAELTGGAKTFDEAALQVLSGFEWKGNVRELRNAVERISIFAEAPEISPAALRQSSIGVSAAPSPDSASFFLSLLRSNAAQVNLLESVERDLIDLALKESHGNAAEAARILGVHRNAFLRRIEKHDLR